MKNSKRRNVENLFEAANFPDDFSAHKVRTQCKTPLSDKFFDCQSEMLKILAQKINCDLSMINISLASGGNFSDTQIQQINDVLCDVLQQHLRKTDQVLDKVFSNGQVKIILPGAALVDTNIIIEKIRLALDSKLKNLISNLTHDFTAHELYSKQAA